MAQISIWRCKFHVEASPGRLTAGPYVACIGLTGGTRNDIQNVSTAALLTAAITTNLLAILKEMTTCAGIVLTAPPAGTVVLDAHDHASIPDLWT